MVGSAALRLTSGALVRVQLKVERHHRYLTGEARRAAFSLGEAKSYQDCVEKGPISDTDVRILRLRLERRRRRSSKQEILKEQSEHYEAPGQLAARLRNFPFS